MKPERINQIIAEYCGIHQMEGSVGPIWYVAGDWHHCPPDYYHDLNAMAQAEEALNDECYSAFTGFLYDAEVDRVGEAGVRWRWLSSSAAQRAEAFVKALNRWEEE